MRLGAAVARLAHTQKVGSSTLPAAIFLNNKMIICTQCNRKFKNIAGLHIHFSKMHTLKKRNAWNKGLTKETNEIVKQICATQSTKKRIQQIEFVIICAKCKNEFKYFSKEKHKIRKCCSRKCANSLSGSSSKGIKRSTINRKSRKKKYHCSICNTLLVKKKKYCEVHMKEAYRAGGQKSASIQSNKRRSKNEILFANICIENFQSVRTNERIFNGWDADVIIDDIKYAILWNGPWHRRKITKDHSVKQVINRDKIKVQEIIKFGYTPFIVEDDTSNNLFFVKNQFKRLLEMIK